MPSFDGGAAVDMQEVRNAVDYVRKNWHKHQRENGRWNHPWYVDPYSSMSGEACFDDGNLIIARPTIWLLKSSERLPISHPSRL